MKDIKPKSYYNVGGGEENTISLNELIRYLSKKLNKHLIVKYEEKRLGDQDYYCTKDKGWVFKNKILKYEGIDMLIKWVQENKELFE